MKEERKKDRRKEERKEERKKVMKEELHKLHKHITSQLGFKHTGFRGHLKIKFTVTS